MFFSVKKINFPCDRGDGGCRAIVASSTDWEIYPCAETQGSNTRSDRAIRNIENSLSAPLTACGGPSVPSIRGSFSKGGGHVQAMGGSTPILCCAVRALSIIGTWLIGKSLLEAINQVQIW